MDCVDIWWSYLNQNGKTDLLHKVFCNWLDVNTGKAWSGELYEAHECANILLPFARGLGWDDEIRGIEDTLNAAKIGYEKENIFL